MRSSITAVCLLVCLLRSEVTGQKTADLNYVVVASTTSPGATMQDSAFKADVATGEGAVTGAMSGGGFVVPGGYASSLDVVVSNTPALIVVRPKYNDLETPNTLVLGGTGLNLSSITGVTIGGVPATRGPSGTAFLISQLQKQSVPGFLTVEIVGSFGKTTLTQGLGIRPLIEVDGDIPGDRPFILDVRGARGDTVILAGSVNTIPVGIPLLNFAHKLLLDPGPLVVMNPLSITDSSGLLRIPLPALNLPPTATFFIQGLVTSTTTSYAPGSFTNVLKF